MYGGSAGGAFGVGTSFTLGPKGQDLNSQHFQVGPEIHQNLRGNALGFSQQPEQEVLRPNVIVLEAAGLLHRILDDLLGPGRLREFTHSNHVGPALDELLHFQADLAEIDIQLPQHIGGHAAALLDQTEEICSVPIYSWLNRRASWLASCITLRRDR